MKKMAISISLGALLAACSGNNAGNSDGGATAMGDVVVNELYPHGVSVTDPKLVSDYAELKNKGKTAVDLTSYKVRDSSLSHLFAIPDGTKIEPGGYLLIYCDDPSDGGAAGIYTGWKLSASGGDEFHFVGPDGKDVDSAVFASDLADPKSWGRLPDGTGSFIPVTPSPGAQN